MRAGRTQGVARSVRCARDGRVWEHRGSGFTRRQRRDAVVPEARGDGQPRHPAHHRAPRGRSGACAPRAPSPPRRHHVRVLRRAGWTGHRRPDGERGDGRGKRPGGGAKRARRALRRAVRRRVRGQSRGAPPMRQDRVEDIQGSHAGS